MHQGPAVALVLLASPGAGRYGPFWRAVGLSNPVISLRAGWKETLERYDVHTALIAVDGALAALLRESEAWQEVYVDDVAAIFASTNTQGTQTSAPRQRNT